jgi:hypothetical protein
MRDGVEFNITNPVHMPPPPSIMSPPRVVRQQIGDRFNRVMVDEIAMLRSGNKSKHCQMLSLAPPLKEPNSANAISFSPTCVACFELTASITTCGHHLCASCYEAIESKRCPACCAAVAAPTSQIFIARLIADMDVSMSCGAAIKRSDIGSHIQGCLACALTKLKNAQQSLSASQTHMAALQQRVNDLGARLAASLTKTEVAERAKVESDNMLQFTKTRLRSMQAQLDKMESSNQKLTTEQQC